MTKIEEHHFVYINLDHLHLLRQKLRSGDEALARVYSSLVCHADAILAKPITSVLDKTGLASSGIKQDFFSIGAYSWPNPDMPDRIPYIRRDGMRNPEAYESEEYDKGRFGAMVEDVNLLTLAYFHSGNECYAEKAAAFLRSWFIDPNTRMNPNLRHAAVQPGVDDGRHSGIIEGVVMIEMLDHVALLRESNAWTDSDISGLRSWFLEFSEWLTSSKFGRTEIHSTNNHGSYYLAQVMAFAAFGGNHHRAAAAIPFARRQLNRQFSADGSIPREMSRSNSFFYSIYGLRAFVVLARLAERYGQDLWRYRIGDQETPAIANSFSFLSPYLTGEKEWDGPRLDTGFSPYAIQICRMAGAVYHAHVLSEMVEFLVKQPSATGRFDALVGLSQIDTRGAEDALFRQLPAPATKFTRESKVSKAIQKTIVVMSRNGFWPGGRIN